MLHITMPVPMPSAAQVVTGADTLPVSHFSVPSITLFPQTCAGVEAVPPAPAVFDMQVQIGIHMPVAWHVLTAL